jgi:DNA-binding transcriptional LysR family regulator
MFPMNLDDMAVFAAVVTEGSFTAAAHRLGVTKQSVSERIARLEHRLGVQLLVRTTRALRLTDVGSRYHETCATIVAHAQRADLEARNAQQHASGTVRVTAPIGLGASLLVPTAREFCQLHPAVRLDLVLDEGIVDLVRAGVDLALRAGSLESTPNLIAKRLFETSRIVVASPALVAAHGRPAEPGALAKLPCVTRRRNETWAIDSTRVEVDGAVTVNTYEAAREVALAGLGFAQVPAPIVLEDIQAGRLVLVLTPTRGIVFTAIWPSKRLPTRVRLFYDLLAQRAARLAAAIDTLGH